MCFVGSNPGVQTLIGSRYNGTGLYNEFFALRLNKYWSTVEPREKHHFADWS